MSDIVDLGFVHPFSMVVNGPSGCGKTEWIKKFLYHSMVSNGPDKIMWCYSKWQDSYAPLEKLVDFTEGLKGLNRLNKEQRTLVIIDDLMTDMDKRVMNLFVRGRHNNLSVILVTHNIFYKAPELRTIRLNTNFLVLFKNPCDTAQIMALGRQMFPRQSKTWMEAYEDATNRLYGYLLVDNRPQTREGHRLRTQIFPNEEQFMYQAL